MSIETFTDQDGETFKAYGRHGVVKFGLGEEEGIDFYTHDAEKIVKIIRQASGYYDDAAEPQDACDQSDGEKSDPTINDPHAILAYRKVALDAALDYTSKASWPGVNVTDIITTAARFEKFLFEGATK
jgi:hypothetical protein